MTLEITSRDTLDSTVVAGDFASFINDLNIAAAAGKQYVLCTEIRNGEHSPVALETRNITRIRDLGAHDAFIGS
jgi:hypothetical protein